jgi:ABC-type amino acid transport substrate-binding protein
MKNKILIFFLQLIIISNFYSVTIEVYSLQAMPYCGIINGETTGIAVEILNEATKYGAPKFIFNFNMPWARAQKNIRESKGELIAIIPFSRTEQREEEYKWISELVLTQSRFFSYGRDETIKLIEDIYNSTVGVVRDHAIISRLEDLGLRKFDDGSANAEANARKLLNKRFDIIADSDVIAFYSWKVIGQNSKDLQIGPKIGDATGVYIASGLIFLKM